MRKLKKMSPIARTIEVNNETIRKLKLLNQELSALLPRRKVPDKTDLFLMNPLTGEKVYYNRK